MKLHALNNRLEDLGEDRDVIVRVLDPNYEDIYVEYDVVGAEPDDKDAHEEGATVVLTLRQRAASD